MDNSQTPDSSPQVIEFPDNHLAAILYGELDAHLRLIEDHLYVSLHSLGNRVVITASAAQ